MGSRSGRWSSYRRALVGLVVGILLFTGAPLAAWSAPTPTPTPSVSSSDEASAQDQTTDDATPLEDETTPADEESPKATPTGGAVTEKPSDEPTADDEESASPEDSDSPSEDNASESPTSSATASRTPSRDVGVQAVPPATGNNAVITVKVGGARTTPNAVGNLAGVTLGLFANENDTSPVTGFTSTCISDTAGDCSFIVPNTQAGPPAGANRDRQFWVKQISPPAPGTYSSTSLGTGSPVASAPYRFQTCPQLRATVVCSSQATGNNGFMLATGNEITNASSGIWQNSLTNPTFPAKCGINVALVLDLSGSVGSDLGNLKTAANTFVNSLQGTPSQVGVFNFASSAPANGAANGTLPLTSVSTAAGATVVTTKIDGLTLGTGQGAGTNWDRGIYQVSQSPSAADFDVAVVITDGNPTFYGATDPDGSAQGPGNLTRFREVENGIFSANAVKADGTRVIAFGVGSGINNTGSGLNLRSISGDVRYNGTNGTIADYYQTSDYAAAGAALRALALGNCVGSLSVIKQVIPTTAPPGSTTGAQPDGGWTFSAASQTPNVAVDAPTSRVTADGTGAVNFPLTFTAGATTGTIAVTETQQPGYTLQQVSGANAVCRRVDTNAPVTVTNSGATGFTVPAASTYPVSCIVYNRAPNPVASVVLNKQWVINGTTYAQGDQPQGFGATGTINGTNQPWGIPRLGFTAGDSVALNEIGLQAPPQCTLVSNLLTLANGTSVSLALPSNQTLVGGLNTYRITNTYTCRTRLTLNKLVTGGDEPATTWTLDAVAPAGALPGPNGATGSPGATGQDVSPGVTYPLAESGGPLEYAQFVAPNAVLVPGSTGSWGCLEVGPDGETVIPGFSDGLNGGVTVPFGSWVRCVAINQTASLRLVKEVINDNGGTAVPANWNLIATPTGTFPAGLPTVTQPGASFADAEVVHVRPGVAYSLSESGGVPGYANTSIQCEAVSPRADATTITLQPGDIGTCFFVNDDQPATLTLVKTVTNDNGGDAEATDWTLTATGPTTGISGSTNDPAVTAAQVPPGSYTLSETGPAGYTPSAWTCVDADDNPVTVTNSAVPVALGQDITCTINNNDQPAQLTLVKIVDNGTTGGTATPANWTLTATGENDTVTGTGDSDDIINQTVDAGDYDLTETGGPAGYTASLWTCVDTADDPVTVTDATVTLPTGGDITCTITNTAQQAQLTLVKTVTNDNGGDAEATEWTLTATGPTTGISGATGDDAVTDVPVTPGSYTLAETGGPAGYTPSAWTCVDADDNPVTVTNSAVPVALGQDITCTINNNDQPAQLTLVKIVDNGTTGGTATPANWTLTATGENDTVTGTGDSDDIINQTVDAGDYDLTETGGPAGYTPSAWTCVDTADDPVTVTDATVTLPTGGDITCTITNTAQQAQLTLVKTVTNDNGGDAEATEWTLTATGPTTGISGATGDDAVTDVPVTPGSYTLAETGGPAGYTPSAWTCVDADDNPVTVTNSAVPVALGQDITCTINNNDQPAQLTLVKIVDNGTTGGTATPANWTLTATGENDTVTGTGDSDDIIDQTVDAGDYDLTETGGPAGYTPSAWTCVDTADDPVTVTAGTVTLPTGGDITCTITNTAQPAHLTLIKTVDNGVTGATTPATDWTLTAVNGDSTITGVTETDPVTGAEAVVGTYNLSESDIPGYTTTGWVCTGASGGSTASSATLALGDDAICRITNTAVPPRLTLVKEVVNGFGGDAEPQDWILAADGLTSFDGPGNSTDVTNQIVQVGDYELSESGGPGGYTPGDWECGDAELEGSTVTVPLGADITCTIVNTELPAHLTLIKVVSPEVPTSHVPADWTLTAEPQDIDGQETVSGNGDQTSTGGVNRVEVFSGEYELSEDGPAGFEGSLWECPGGVVNGNVVTVPSGGDVTCTITNTAIAPHLTLVKQIDDPNQYGTAAPTDWTLTAELVGTGEVPDFQISGATGDPAVTDAAVLVGTYALTESGPANYTASDWTCVDDENNPVTVTGGSVTLAEGDDVTCTIVNTPVPPSWSIAKLSDPPSGVTVDPGDEITYGVFLIRNEGSDPQDVVVNDDLSQVLNNATLVDGPTTCGDADCTVDYGTATISGTTLTWNVPVLDQPIAYVQYTVRVNDDAYGVTLSNHATSPGSSPCVPDDTAELASQRLAADALASGPAALSTAAVSAQADDELCPDHTDHYTPAWSLEKTSDPESGSEVDQGDQITYTLTVTNTTDNAVVDDAVVTDDLSDVLQYATLDSVPSGATLSGDTLTWNVPELQPGESAELTYTVTVDDDAYDVEFGNVATPGDGGTCPNECQTDHYTPPKPGEPSTHLPNTGGTSLVPLGLGFGFLLAGGLVLNEQRRRRLAKVTVKPRG